jgi:hypothetical protein
VYRNIRYTLDRGHPLQVPCGRTVNHDIAYSAEGCGSAGDRSANLVVDDDGAQRIYLRFTAETVQVTFSAESRTIVPLKAAYLRGVSTLGKMPLLRSLAEVEEVPTTDIDGVLKF